MTRSCWGCKYLYSSGEGYSNFTWLETNVNCAKDRNPNLPAGEPYDWNKDADADNWPKTNQSRCDLYAPGAWIELDIDGEVLPDDYTQDAEVIEAVDQHSGRQEEHAQQRALRKATAERAAG
jgi:hypothetical protein